MNLNRIKDIRKINLFQEEIKEEEKNEIKKIDIIFENKVNNDIKEKKDNSPKITLNKNMIEDISLVNDSNDLIDKNNIIESVINSNEKAIQTLEELKPKEKENKQIIKEKENNEKSHNKNIDIKKQIYNKNSSSPDNNRKKKKRRKRKKN